MIKMSSIPYFALEILRAIKRRMTAMIDMVQTTEMDAAASAHRLSLSEGTSLTQSWGIIAKVSKFFKFFLPKSVQNQFESCRWCKENLGLASKLNNAKKKKKKKSFTHVQFPVGDRLRWEDSTGASRWNQTHIRYKRSQSWDHRLSHWRHRKQALAI